MTQKLKNTYMIAIRRAGYVVSLDFDETPRDIDTRNATKKPKDKQVCAKYTLDIQCPFRFCLADKVVLGFYELARHFDSSLGDTIGNTHFDSVVSNNIALPLQVQKVSLNAFNDIAIDFANGLRLEIFINANKKIEHYRLIEAKSTIIGEYEANDYKHFVIYEEDK